jgi:hypothetical protein
MRLVVFRFIMVSLYIFDSENQTPFPQKHFLLLARFRGDACLGLGALISDRVCSLQISFDNRSIDVGPMSTASRQP